MRSHGVIACGVSKIVAPFRVDSRRMETPRKVYRPKPHIPTMSTAEDARSDHCSRVSARIGDGTRCRASLTRRPLP